MACTSCAAEALGISTDAQYLADYPGCGADAAQLIYCVGERLVAAPRGCTTTFGTATTIYSNGPYTMFAGGTFDNAIQNEPFGTVNGDLAFTNNTCYPMQLIVSPSLLYNLHFSDPDGDPAQPDKLLSTSMIIRLNGGPDFYPGSGGVRGIVGNNPNGWHFDTPTYVANVPGAQGILAPGAGATLSVRFGTEVGPAHPVNVFDFIVSFRAAARITGQTVCPV